MALKKIIPQILLNALGWHTNRKIVVFESDDWGSLRINSKNKLEKLKAKGIELDKDQYAKYDSLENVEDLSSLFDILKKYKDKNGNTPKLTTNFLTSNPDFEKINRYKFKEYHYIDLESSYAKYSGGKDVFNLVRNGFDEKFIYPQFHGREHLNVPLWLNELHNGNKELLDAFNEEVFAIPLKKKLNSKNNPTAAFDSIKEKDIYFYKKSIHEGLELFQKYFGFVTKTMIAPSYIWSSEIEKAVFENKILAFQGIPFQYIPIQNGKLKKKFHYTGQKNKLGQYYLVRNAFFEPSLDPKKDWVDECLSRIELAFKFKKPAIIGTHRVNFIGSIEESNRTKNLKLFDKLLQSILKKWPEVEFTTSDKIIMDKE